MALRLSTGLRDKLIGAKANIVSNGNFNTNTAGWTAADATITAAAGGSSSTTGLQIANSSAASGSAYQDLTTRIGRVYKVTVKGKVGDADGFQVKIGTTADDDANLASTVYTDTELKEKTFVFIALATTTRLTLVNSSATSAEAVIFDDVVVEELLDGFTEIMRKCKINVYTGAQPTTANDAATGSLLFTVTKGGDGTTGLDWNPASSGAASKPSGDTWAGTAIADGTAGWFRCYEEGDDPSAASTTNARFDGSVATSGAQINMTSTAIANGAVQTVSSFTYTQPAA